MAFSAVLQPQPNEAVITLTGELDANTAAQFQAELQKAVDLKPKALVLNVAGLEYMASAGVRMLIFAKQKLGPAVKVYIIAPQDTILDTLKRTGLHHSFIVQQEYQPEA